MTKKFLMIPEENDGTRNIGASRHSQGGIVGRRDSVLEYDKEEREEGTPNAELPENEELQPRPKKRRYHSPWSIFIRLFYSPLTGWKQLKNSAYSPDRTASKVFYPLVALASLGQFASKIYYPSQSLGYLLQSAVGIFISFFIGYFLVVVLCRSFLPADAKTKIDTPYGRKWLQYLMATLTLFFTIYELCPVLEPLLVFAPIFTVYLALRGVRFLRIKEASDNLVGWTVGLLCIVIPYGIYYVFDAIMPTAQ